MNSDLKAGLSYEIERVVMAEHLAEAYGSGGSPVFATPHMIAMMEGAALMAVEKLLDDGCTTVGTKVNIEHLASTPEGMKVRAVAKLTEADGRRLVFDVEAWDERERIGAGTHERFIVQKEKFLAKTSGKK